MSDLVDLSAEREKRNGPDPDQTLRDDCGRQMFKYSLSYQFHGAEWSFELWAYSSRDAEERAEAIRRTVEVAGQVMSQTPA